MQGCWKVGGWGEGLGWGQAVMQGLLLEQVLLIILSKSGGGFAPLVHPVPAILNTCEHIYILTLF